LAIKSELYKCVECQIRAPKANEFHFAPYHFSRMGDGLYPFYYTGTDLFGPFVVGFGKRTPKRWGAVFICHTTRACHLEMVDSMNTDSFLMALDRFTHLRNVPCELFCDQGRNLVGAAREIQEMLQEAAATPSGKLAEREIKFNFNPVGSPH
jgi:hypothetical protein